MPAKPSRIVLAAALCACATPTPPTEPEGADRLDAAVAETVRAGRSGGYPDLAAIPRPGATPADAKALADDADALAEEASELRALRAAANAPRPESDLSAKARRLRREVARARSELADQPAIPSPR